MKTIILYASSHHGNTQKVAQAMAEELNAQLVDLTRESAPDLTGYDLIGVASGIYYGKPHSAADRFLAQAVPAAAGQKAFAVCTSGAKKQKYAEMLEKRLADKGYTCVGGFWCQGYDTFGPFKLVGGIAKGHPNEEDLSRARAFAKGLCQ